MSPYLQINILDDIIGSILESMTGLFRGFNFVCYNIFQYGTLILFLFYLSLGGFLLVSAKNIEHKHRIYGKNLEFIKKRGRISAAILVSVAILFLFKALPFLLLWFSQGFTLPPFAIWFGGVEVVDALNSIVTIKDQVSIENKFEISKFLHKVKPKKWEFHAKTIGMGLLTLEDPFKRREIKKELDNKYPDKKLHYSIEYENYLRKLCEKHGYKIDKKNIINAIEKALSDKKKKKDKLNFQGREVIKELDKILND